MRRTLVCAAAALAAALALPAGAGAEIGYLRSIPPLKDDGSAAPWPYGGGPIGLTADRIRDELLLIRASSEGNVLQRLTSSGEPVAEPVAVRGGSVTMTSAADPAQARIFIPAGGGTDVYDGLLRPLGTLAELAGIAGAVEVVNDEGDLATPADDMAYALDGNGLVLRNIARFNPITGAVQWRTTARNAAASLEPSTRSLMLFAWKGESWGSGNLTRVRPDGAVLPAGELFTMTYGFQPARPHTTAGETVFDSTLKTGNWGDNSYTGIAMVNYSQGRTTRFFGDLDVPDAPRRPNVGCRYTSSAGAIAVGGRDLIYVTDARGRIDVFGEGGDRRWCGRSARPEPRLTVTPGGRVAVGTAVRFDPGLSVPDFGPEAIASDPDRIVSYEWDLDGDGVFELERGTPEPVVLTATAPGRLRADLRVTDSFGASYATRATAEVPASSPAAVLDVKPAEARTGETIVLDAGRSTGGIARFEWDLDLDGGYEYDTGADPVRAVRYTEPGVKRVSVRVTAHDGQRAETTASVAVSAFADAGIPPAAGVEQLVPGIPLGAPADPAPRDRVAPRLTLPRRLRAVGGRVTVALPCPVAEQGCLGEVRLGAARALFSAGGGEIAAVRLRLPAATRSALSRRRSVRTALTMTVRDAAGNARRQRAKVVVAR